jgi:hypothetical protein
MTFGQKLLGEISFQQIGIILLNRENHLYDLIKQHKFLISFKIMGNIHQNDNVN